MPARLRRLALELPFALVLLVLVGMSTTTAASPFAYDTYFGSAYERQIDNRTCVAASTAMMLNILNGRDLNFNQMAILRYAQERDALNYPARGTDPRGWARALNHFSQYTIRPTKYRWEAYDTESEALRRAARQITRYGKAVGLLVQNGQHAAVMNGFVSTRNPLEGSFTLMGVWVSDPLGPSNRYYSAASSPLGRYLETDATASYDEAWYGKYIVIVPVN